MDCQGKLEVLIEFWRYAYIDTDCLLFFVENLPFYSILFSSPTKKPLSFRENTKITAPQQPVAEEIFNHAQSVLVFHGLDTIATITLNNHKLLPNPNNMFVRYQYDVRNKLIRVFISIAPFPIYNKFKCFSLLFLNSCSFFVLFELVLFVCLW